MSIELKVPVVGESITEAIIDQWLKKEGDWVDQDEPLVVIETDKVTVELSPFDSSKGRIVYRDKGGTEELR